jgi:hypothetical protein
MLSPYRKRESVTFRQRPLIFSFPKLQACGIQLMNNE